MDKSEKVTVVKPEVKVEVAQKISQQDVIELVAYKQIKKLEENKKSLSDDLDKVAEKLKESDTKYKDSILKEVTKMLTPFLGITENKYDIKISSDNTPKVELTNTKGNHYPSIFAIDIEKLSTKKTKTHIELEEKKKQLSKSIDNLNNEIYKIKNDKNSIKNAITEQLLLESEEGRDLLSLVEKAYGDTFPKLLN